MEDVEIARQADWRSSPTTVGRLSRTKIIASHSCMHLSTVWRLDIAVCHHHIGLPRAESYVEATTMRHRNRLETEILLLKGRKPVILVSKCSL